jgi:hypothetical protein
MRLLLVLQAMRLRSQHGSIAPNVGASPSDRGAITVPFPENMGRLPDLTMELETTLVTDMGRLLDMRDNPDNYKWGYCLWLGGTDKAKNFFWKQIERGGAWDLIKTQTEHHSSDPIFTYRDVTFTKESWGNFAVGVRARAAGLSPDTVKAGSLFVVAWNHPFGRGFDDIEASNEAVDQDWIDIGYAHGAQLMPYVVPCQEYFTWKGH